MKHVTVKLTLMTAMLLIFAGGPALAVTQQTNANRPTVKGEMKQIGKETKEAGKSLGSNVKHGRVARGGKQFGKHVYRAGKHFGKGTKISAKKTAKVVKKAVKP